MLVLSHSGLTEKFHNADDNLVLAAQPGTTVQASGFGDSQLESASLKFCWSLTTTASSWNAARRDSRETGDFQSALGQAEAWHQCVH